jgi:hypothetical protein
MNNFDSEASSMELAAQWMQQVRACLELIREEAKANPEEARCLLRPAEELANELDATQSTLHSLTEQIHTPVETPSLFR